VETAARWRGRTSRRRVYLNAFAFGSLLVAVLPASAAGLNGGVVAWGCGANDFGQCRVPAAARSGVTAIAAGTFHSLALKKDGSVVAWGCVGPPDAIIHFGQCRVPASARSGVIAIAAGTSRV